MKGLRCLKRIGPHTKADGLFPLPGRAAVNHHETKGREKAEDDVEQGRADHAHEDELAGPELVA